MKSQTIIEFREKLILSSHDDNKVAQVFWESPRLSTAFPITGQPAGSDRAICRTVNGFVRVCYFDVNPQLRVYSGLFGEYAGTPALIQDDSASLEPRFFDYNRNGNGVCFSQFITYSNLVESVFIRVVTDYYSDPLSPFKIPIEISGVLIAADPTVS
jgi:hypothetical protein